MDVDGTLTDGKIYMGDDILDLQCMEPVNAAGGITACPADAVEAVRKACTFVSSRKGGEGAVREFIEWVTEKASS